jgi:hypothetical protein
VNHDNAFSATSLPGNLPRLQKGGYWLGGSGDGYGYPLGGMGYPQPIAADDNRTITNDQARPGPAKGYGYFQRRPAYSPNPGSSMPCEQVLATTLGIYTRCAAELQDRGTRPERQSVWQVTKIAAAVPVTARRPLPVRPINR